MKALLNKAQAIKDTFSKLTPQVQIKNPVMFIVYLGAIVCSLLTLSKTFQGHRVTFEVQITLWLWFTVLFANFAESLAEGRGKAQAASLKKMRADVMAKLLKDGQEKEISANDLNKDDVVVCRPGDLIPADGEVIAGIASVDESAVTGESAPVIRESGGDRSAVIGGTKVLSDGITIKVTAKVGESFLDKMIAMVEGSARQITPNEIALNLLLIGLTSVFVLAVFTLVPIGQFIVASSGKTEEILTVVVLTALLVCLIPTTIGGLLSAIGISGMDRLLRRNVVAMSGKAVEAAGDVDVLLLDKTGTITLGNRMASEIIPAQDVPVQAMAEVSQLASLPDETPEGRSIVVLLKQKFGLRAPVLRSQPKFVPFSAQTRMSGVDVLAEDGVTIRRIRKGAADAVQQFVTEQGGIFKPDIRRLSDDYAKQGATPLIVCEDNQVMGIIVLKDVVKGGLRERFTQLRRMGIRTVMITGDNPLTAAAIAAEAGVDDFIAQATPETKLKRIREEQMGGHLVAMIGDGTNDAPALAQADVGVAMNTGTQAAREAGNMLDLDSDPTKLIEIIEIGKQLLMTRGALTTFSIANDVAKYFAILPALFASIYARNGELYGPLAKLNVMGLHSPQSAILSATIFNALIIVALIPLALKGVKYRAEPAVKILRTNLLLYGVGGLIVPFLGIKIIDILIVSIGFV